MDKLYKAFVLIIIAGVSFIVSKWGINYASASKDSFLVSLLLPVSIMLTGAEVIGLFVFGLLLAELSRPELSGFYSWFSQLLAIGAVVLAVVIIIIPEKGRE